VDRNEPHIPLQRVLALFDGRRTIKDILSLLPSSLRDYGLDIAVFFLRSEIQLLLPLILFFLLMIPIACVCASYNMLSLVNQYILNCHNLLKLQKGSSTELLTNETISSRASTGMTRNISFNVNVGESRSDLSTGLQSSTHNYSSSTFSITSFPTEPLSPNAMRSTLSSFNEHDKAIYERLMPHIQNQTISNKTIFEIMLYAKVNEADFFRILQKLPHLKLVIM
jgi:hypothetical protein